MLLKVDLLLGIPPFNNRTDETSKYHDDKRYMSEEGEKCVREVLYKWELAGVRDQSLPYPKTWKVTELL